MKKIIAALGVILGLSFAAAPAQADDLHNPLPNPVCYDSHGQVTPCQPPTCYDSHGQVTPCPGPVDEHPTATAPAQVDHHPHLRSLRLRH